MSFLKFSLSDISTIARTSLASIIVLAGVAFTQVNALTEKISDSAAEKLKAELLRDVNRDIEFALEKQREKLERDPADLKAADLARLTYHCEGYFGKSYVPTVPADRRLKVMALCGKITNLYVGG